MHCESGLKNENKKRKVHAWKYLSLCSDFSCLFLELQVLTVIHQGLTPVLASDMLRNDPIIPEEDEPISYLNVLNLSPCIQWESKPIASHPGGALLQACPFQGLDWNSSIGAAPMTLSIHCWVPCLLWVPEPTPVRELCMHIHACHLLSSPYLQTLQV